nr:hypothetical protein CFP56_05382 [Quercus suber]
MKHKEFLWKRYEVPNLRCEDKDFALKDGVVIFMKLAAAGFYVVPSFVTVDDIKGDKCRDISFPQLLDLSLPYVEISFDGNVCVAKVEGSGGVLNVNTCAEQLLYEVGDLGAYVTPDVIINIRDVLFLPMSSSKVLRIGAKPSAASVPDKLLRFFFFFLEKLLRLVPKDCGWKGWGEISYRGSECVKRAQAAEFLVDAPAIYASLLSEPQPEVLHPTCVVSDGSPLVRAEVAVGI